MIGKQLFLHENVWNHFLYKFDLNWITRKIILFAKPYALQIQSQWLKIVATWIFLLQIGSETVLDLQYIYQTVALILWI